LDIPTKGHIPSLVSAFDKSPFYAKFRSTRVEDLGEYAVRSVFHICGDGVLEDERYVAFMNGFAPHVDVRDISCFIGVELALNF
jgi:ribonuclease Z